MNQEYGRFDGEPAPLLLWATGTATVSEDLVWADAKVGQGECQNRTFTARRCRGPRVSRQCVKAAHHLLKCRPLSRISPQSLCSPYRPLASLRRAGRLRVLDAVLRPLLVGEVRRHTRARRALPLMVIGRPHPGGPIVACCCDVLAVRRDVYRYYSGGVADKASYLPVCLHIPKPRHTILTAGGDPLTIRGKDCIPYLPCVAGEAAYLLSGVNVPQPGRAVASGKHHFAVRREDGGIHRRSMPPQRQHYLARLEIPDFNLLISTRRDDQLAIRRKCYARHVIAVTREGGQHLLARLCIQEMCCVSRVADEYPPFIWGDGPGTATISDAEFKFAEFKFKALKWLAGLRSP